MLCGARRVAAFGAVFLALVAWNKAAAQVDQAASGPATADLDRNSPPYTSSVESRLTIRPDLTAVIDTAVRLKVLRESAIRSLGQQSLTSSESTGPLDVIEAYTEKSDGTKSVVDEAHILTRDAATGLNSVYQRDSKVKTLIFPDIEVGDTLVYTFRINKIDKRYPGQFTHSVLLAQSIPYGTYRLTVDEPKSLALKVHIRGAGLSHETAEAGEDRRHTFSYRSTRWAPNEPGAVAAADRDPQIIITTFKDATEVGAGYWSSMKDKDVVTPEIQALADEITKGIDNKRAQAEAIDRWIKKNIRYVLVFLGSGGVTPNPAPTVLKNKYGDCKDHVALMGAMLKAKGIASEQTLINTGNIYGLPELLIPNFNHVMLYLPEFGLYTDPTASHASFGILPESAYDKPVLHISAAGGRLARTPPMKPEDHVVMAKTIASIGADGVIKGTTRETATGIFATVARGAGIQIQAQGREKFAEGWLRALGIPGTGLFEPVMPFDYSEPFVVQGAFSLNEKLQTPLDGVRSIPFGMPILGRLGGKLLGRRVPGRTTDFVCYAGKQVEEIELTFEDGLPLPRTIKGISIDNKYVSYRSSYALAGRTLTIRRELESKVAGQRCTKEIEAEISEPMQRVARSMRAQMSFGATAPGSDAARPE
jgi:transglutaminase-like putative cysteine protease